MERIIFLRAAPASGRANERLVLERAACCTAKRKAILLLITASNSRQIHQLCKSSGQFYTSLHASEIIIGFSVINDWSSLCHRCVYRPGGKCPRVECASFSWSIKVVMIAAYTNTRLQQNRIWDAGGIILRATMIVRYRASIFTPICTPTYSITLIRDARRSWKNIRLSSRSPPFTYLQIPLNKNYVNLVWHWGTCRSLLQFHKKWDSHK